MRVIQAPSYTIHDQLLLGRLCESIETDDLVGAGITEYKIWKKNAPFLYDLILRYSHLTIQNRKPSKSKPVTDISLLFQLCIGMADIDHPVVPRQTNVRLPFPLNVQTLIVARHPGKNYSTHRLLIGTHTSGNDTNYLQIAEVQLPNPLPGPDPHRYDEGSEEIGGYGGGAECRLHIQQKMVHEGEVNKARYMPQKPDLIATMCADGNVLVFDKTKHPLMPTNTTKCTPQMTLVGHGKEG